MPEQVITDTSVLIALEKLNALQLLCKVYSQVWVPEAVKREFGPISLPCVAAKNTKGKLAHLLINDLNLGAGEAEVISIASENNLTVMIDDMRARKVAENMGLSVTGTVGFLLKAKRLNLIESAFEKAQELRRLGFYISDSLLGEIQDIERNRKG